MYVRILLDKQTTDAHDNPTLNFDAAGHLWIFSNAHGTSRPSFIHKSAEPYSIDKFVPIADQVVTAVPSSTTADPVKA